MKFGTRDLIEERPPHLIEQSSFVSPFLSVVVGFITTISLLFIQ